MNAAQQIVPDAVLPRAATNVVTVAPNKTDINTHKVLITRFEDETAQAMSRGEHTLPDWCDHILAENAKSKGTTPWLKLATFSDARSDKGCLRTDINVSEITGVECDYDDEAISFDEAMEVMRSAGVRCLLYTSASHSLETPRWRILAPLSKNHPPASRAPMVGRLNGLFEGKLAAESFVLSTSYHYGSVNNNPHHRAEVLDGQFLDLKDSLYAGSIDKDGHRVGHKDFEQPRSSTGKPGEPGNAFSNYNPNPADKGKIVAALAVIDADCGHVPWYKIACAIRFELGDEGNAVFHEWSATAKAIYKYAECEKKWKEAEGNPYHRAGSIFRLANLASPNWRDEYESDVAGDGIANEGDERVANQAPIAATLPTIRINPRISVLTTSAQKMLVTARVPFYQRGGELVRPIIRTVQAAHGRLTNAAQLKAISPTYMRDTMCRHARWERFDKRENDWVPAQAPKPVAETLLDRDGVWGFPEIVGVIATPTMRSDGSLLIKQGYDKATRLLLIEPPPMPEIPEKPTRDDALAALALLDDLISETPFDNEASKAVGLSGLITPVVRGAFPVAPMHVSSAPVAGSGKSFLWDLAAAISAGQQRMPVIAASDEKETEKRLIGVMLTGQPLISIDNVNGELKGDFLCQAIEQQFLDIRALSLSVIKRVETGGVTIFATGNNITIVGDLCRRTITARLDAKLENPQLREFRNDPIGKILDNRGRYIAACLTICRAYIVAGRPSCLLPRLASFEGWSDTVRSALVWLGKADAVDSMEDTRAEDPQRAALCDLLHAWEQAHGVGKSSEVPLTAIIDKAIRLDAAGELWHAGLNAAVQAATLEISGSFPGAKIDAARFGIYCRTRKEVRIDGLFLTNRPSSRGGAATWWVERVPG
jgi:putative DNA primase/helicase